jgi:flavin reductase (DIM6/NTAB) family NADH-FMN oxidoreductase RutF
MHLRAHYTSAKFGAGVSEFEACNFEEEYLDGFPAPFVKESPIKVGMKWIETLKIRANNTTLVIGEVEQIILNEGILKEDGQLDLNAAKAVTISGLNRYHKAIELNQLPYARLSELPDFIDYD